MYLPLYYYANEPESFEIMSVKNIFCIILDLGVFLLLHLLFGSRSLTL